MVVSISCRSVSAQSHDDCGFTSVVQMLLSGGSVVTNDHTDENYPYGRFSANSYND